MGSGHFWRKESGAGHTDIQLKTLSRRVEVFYMKIIKSTAPIGGVFQIELKWFNLKAVLQMFKPRKPDGFRGFPCVFSDGTLPGGRSRLNESEPVVLSRRLPSGRCHTGLPVSSDSLQTVPSAFHGTALPLVLSPPLQTIHSPDSEPPAQILISSYPVPFVNASHEV